MKVTLGGERVGSGNKMPIHMRNYERSTHNLSQAFRSSMGVGILTPCYCAVALRGDKFDLRLAAGARTIPSKGALFGSYKLQVDYYFCPVRLYTGILHNNPVNIGLNMKNVYFPTFKSGGYADAVEGGSSIVKYGFAKNSLLHYLGLSGIGNGAVEEPVIRTFNAIPVLAYYDICKNYYCNKQESKAHAISVVKQIDKRGYNINTATINTESTTIYDRTDDQNRINKGIVVTIDGINDIDIELSGSGRINPENIYYRFVGAISGEGTIDGGVEPLGNSMPHQWGQVTYTLNDDPEQQDFISINFTNNSELVSGILNIYFKDKVENTFKNTLEIKNFNITNFDDMRASLLSYHTMGAALDINSLNIAPYSYVAPNITTGSNWKLNPNFNALNGLMLKTYQSDMFNNWLNTETIDGANGIAQITKVSTSGGGFTIDSLNYAEKMYNLLNRIAVSGNTYEDWQDVVYENTPKKHLESPMYLGGISQEIVFEEIVSTAVTEGAGLGQMGGRGISRHRKGGHVRVKVDEAGFIIGIASITPRVNYGQGNEFYFTDIKTMDDFHKPGLDGIGFQDLIGERLAYFDTICEQGTDDITRHVIGKLPAWIEYMTAVDKVHGDFADEDSDNSFMVLNRNYEFDSAHRCIKDATTYIEPEKYNSAFLYTALDSQNFWVQIEHNVIARRKMSAKQIPNI